MSKALTARAVETAKPDPARRVELPDGGLPGLYLVVQSSGAKSWALRYRHAERPRKLTLGRSPAMTLATAREAARKAMQAIAKGEDPAGEKATAKATRREDPDRDLVRGVVRDFLVRHADKNRSAAEVRRLMETVVLPAWGPRRLDSIKRRDVIEMLDGIVDTGQPQKAAKVFAYVRKLFNWAIERDVIGASPCAGVKAPAAPTMRERTLNDDELRSLWTASAEVGAMFGPFVRLLILTGQRRNEVAAMRWSELDGATWTIPADRTKNGRAHAVSLPPAARAILDTVPRIEGCPFVFSHTGETPISGFSRCKARLDKSMATLAAEEGRDDPIPPWTLHDLRRTAATGMQRAGASLPVVERALNHVSGSFAGIVSTYQRHDYAEEVGRALAAWAGLVERIVNRQEADVVRLTA